MQHGRRCTDAAWIAGGEEAPLLSGCVRSYQENGCVLIEAEISGLPKVSETGFFGFHIHQGRACFGTVFSGIEDYSNPLGQWHPEHAGDLPQLLW